MLRRTLLAATAALFALTASAQAQNIRVGTLDCRSPGAVSFIVGSVTRFNCRFIPTRGPVEIYAGRIDRIGLDVGFTSRVRLVWTVLAATPYRRGVLSGVYAGVSAGAAVGIGGGANLLVGGLANSITLQPLSFQGERGANIALTVSALELRLAR